MIGKSTPRRSRKTSRMARQKILRERLLVGRHEVLHGAQHGHPRTSSSTLDHTDQIALARMASVAKPPKSPATITPAERKSLEAAKRASTGQLLLKAARLLDEVSVARVNAEARARGLRLPA